MSTILAFAAGSILTAGALYIGGKIVMKKYLDYDNIQIADVLTQQEEEPFKGPTFYAAVHGVAVKPTNEGIQETRQRLKNDALFIKDISRRTVEYMEVLGMEKERPLSLDERRMVASVSGLAAGMIIEAFTDAGWFIVDREKLAALLKAANQQTLNQDGEQDDD